MNKKDKILALLREKGVIKSREITQTLGISREYANRILQELRNEGIVLLIGKTNRARYVLAEDAESVEKARADIRQISLHLKNRDLEESHIFSRIENETGIFIDVRDNVRRIARNGFEEMLNNAIDHSQSKDIDIDFRRTDTALIFTVRDRGIGIFNNVRDKFRLPNEIAAMQELLKGKTTTDPERHSGQGVFWTSKSADVFIADSFGKRLTVNNLLPDVFFSDRRELAGTRISFSIGLKSERELKKIYDTYAGGEDFEFDKTRITVKLYQFGRDLLSRSEAKRVVLNLENFQTVELDFTGVDTVGQAFADEIFRVWNNRYRETHITTINTNENVAAMVLRAGGQIGQDKLDI
jgi:biotin operon repressor